MILVLILIMKKILIETKGDNIPLPLNSFDDLDLGPVLKNNIKLCTFTTPTPVQRNAIPIVLGGRDLMACAQTGSGKTAAFLFPMISDMVKNMIPDGRQIGSRFKHSKIFPHALILAPTRELAIQIHQEARKFTYRSHIRSVVVYGGTDSKSQINELERGCHILVATPGRLIDIIERGKVDISAIKYLCIDEADRMLDMGFEYQIREIVGQCPAAGARQTLMFSATFPKAIQRLAEEFLSNYVFLKIGRTSATESITQRIKWVEDSDKKNALLELLPTIEGLTLVFCETKKLADHLEEFLYQSGYATASIHGDRNQQEREAALEAFKSGKVQILVATDVAARGLDISAVRHVINYDLPHDIDDYVHRIGRTGRAGHDGYATAFINEKNVNLVSDLLVVLEECGQYCDSWLVEMSNKYGRGGSRPRRGAGGFYGGNRRSGASLSSSGSNFRSFHADAGGYYETGENGGNYSTSKKWW